MKKIFFIISLIIFNYPGYSQTHIPFNNIPKNGTIMIFAHMDDDFIWMLPWWGKCENFIYAATPSMPVFEPLINDQQTYLDTNNWNINYKATWIHPWDDVTYGEFVDYYLHWDTAAYSYLAKDHLKVLWDGPEEGRIEINKIKAKIEPYIAKATTQRIITHNLWGEYGHPHHQAICRAVRELAVKYRKEVWMLGCKVDDNTHQLYNADDTIPSWITYTQGTFNHDLYFGLRDNYTNPLHYLWTWFLEYNPTGEHPYYQIVYNGVDRSDMFGDSVSISGPSQGKPGAYIFDGEDDYLTLKGNNYPSYTIAMWTKPDTLRSMDISKMTEYPSDNICDRSFFMQPDGSVCARVHANGQSQTLTSQPVLSVGNWTHIAMTGDGNSLKIYINGVLHGEINTGAVNSVFNTPEFVIGQKQETSSFFKGQVFDVRLYDYVLTQEEINAISGGNPPEIYTITANAGEGGSITPSGTVIVNNGNSKTLTITTEPLYQIADVKVDNNSVGTVTSYTFNNVTANHTISVAFTPPQSIALNKPAYCQSPGGQGGHLPSFANDEDGSNNSYWQGIPWPMWWEVDLGTDYDISKIVIRNYVDQYPRYYQYEIYASNNSLNYTKIAEKTNSDYSKDEGDSYILNVTARFLRVNMTLNSANSGVHISDFRVYGVPHVSTWTGATDHNWFGVNNWLGEVPTAARNVKIPDTTNYPIISSNAECSDLIIDHSAKVEIEPTGSLTVNGTLTNNAGASGLIIKSDAGGTGSLIEKSGAQATVERYIENNWNWHMLSSPVVGQEIWQEFAPEPTLVGSVYKFPSAPWYWDFYYFNPNCPSDGLFWVNLRKNNDGDYNDGSIDASNSDGGFKDAINTFPPVFEIGRGYLVAYDDGWMNGSPEVHSFSGLLNTGQVERTIISNSNGSDYNLVGNPYPSAIDWDMADGASSWGRNGVLTSSGSGYDYWIWDDSKEQYLFRNSGSQLGDAGEYIEPGQAFFVNAATNPATPLIFRNGIRTHNGDKGWVKSTNEGIKNIRLLLTCDASTISDEMYIDFNSSYTGFEGTQKFWSFYSDVPEIFSVKEDNNYSIDRYREITDDLSVNVNVKCGLNGTYTIQATNISAFSLCNKVYLEDLKNGNKINLREINSYSFTGSPDDSPLRFKITFVKTTGFEEKESLKQMNIYSYGKDIYISTNMLDIGSCEVHIFDNYGRMVYKSSYVVETNHTKCISMVVPGVYIVEAISHNSVTRSKVIIQ